MDREPARSSHQLGRSKSVATSVYVFHFIGGYVVNPLLHIDQNRSRHVYAHYPRVQSTHKFNGLRIFFVIILRHRNNTERDRIKSETEIANLNIPGVTQDMKDLLRWKQYCAKEVLTTKHGPLHSMPTLAKQGAKAYLGRKMIVNMVERKRPHTAA